MDTFDLADMRRECAASSIRRGGGAKRPSVFWGKGTVLNSDGTVDHELDWVQNAVADEGEQSVLNVWLRAQSNPSKYLALLNQASPGETTTMATMTETDTPGSHGYNRQQLLTTDWGAPSLVSGDYKSTAAEVTFGPAVTTSWTLTHAVLVTVSTGTSGLFLLFIALSATTTIAVGQSFKYTLSLSAS
jgi:hypothetical protein